MITIALPKGNLFKDSLDIFEKVGVTVSCKNDISRKLTFCDDSQNYRFIIVRPFDVPVYVEHGAADMGIVGKDIVNESECSITELLDLKFGFCQLVVAAMKNDNLKEKGLFPNMRVATKFVNCTEQYFRKIDLKVEIIKLYGSIELAPIGGLSDAIVDLVATGTTLKENGLEIVGKVFDSTARLVSNRVSFRTKYNQVTEITNAMSRVLNKS